MSRRELREQIFKLLFRIEFNSPEEMPEQEQLFFEDSCEADAADEEYISSKYRKIAEKLETIDEMLNTKTENWNTDRMGKVDLTILRLAVYEIAFDDEVPTGVAYSLHLSPKWTVT